MIFLFLTVALITGVATWLFVPDVNKIRPDIEAFLKQELGLKDLKLGELSWYWAGQLGVKAAASSFSSHDDSIAVHESNITVNISILDFISGKLTPAGIHLSDGAIQVVLNGDSKAQHMPLPDLIALNDMKLNWKYGAFSGQLDHFTMSFESTGHRLNIRIPGGRLEAELGSTRVPDNIEANFSNLRWLPDQWQSRVDGSASGDIRLKKSGANRWHLDVAISSGETTRAEFDIAGTPWRFDSIDGAFVIITDVGGSSISQVEAKKIKYKFDKNMVRANGLWRDGKLELAASSPHLQMPLIWQGLRPLGDASWHAWLASMKHGVASEAKAEVEMAWADPLHGAPSGSELDGMRYHVTAHVTDADIALGVHEDFISRTEGDVELDQQGLKALIASTQLPHGIGNASGGLQIPWETLVLHVAAHGKVDAGKLHFWLDENDATQLNWGTAPAQADVSLQWMPTEERPRQASIKLKPVAPWSLAIRKVPLQINSGSVAWTLAEGMRFTAVEWSTPHLRLKSDMSATKNDEDQWQIRSLRTRAEGKLNELTSYFLLPIKAAGGSLRLALDFDGGWHGSLDLKDASWVNFLGTKKTAGRDFSINYSGVNGKRQDQAALLIKDIHCEGELLRLHGSGDISASGLRLDLHQIESESFAGAVKVLAPFGSDPWELDVKASYLNRRALPDSLARKPGTMKKPWAMRANLERFVWGDAEIRGVSLNLASVLNSIAVLKAASLHSGEFIITDISTIFSMQGGGVVDLRSFEAALDSLHIKLSATLVPGAEDSMQWHGFAQLNGNFGDIMKKTQLSNIFQDGDMRILFSGQGELFNNQPWWQGLDGRVRMRVDNGRIMKGGTLSKFLAATSLADLPALFIGDRDDLTKPGLGYKRLQMEAVVQHKNVQVRKLAMRSSAMDVAGKGTMDLSSSHIDLTLVMRPLQNLDALLAKLPLIRDIFGGAAHSLMRKVYWMHGPISNAEVEQVSPEEAGLASAGMIETLLGLPERWFGKESPAIAR